MTGKQRAFVEAYLANGFNATKAAITAGYSAKTARSIGSENLTKPNISAMIEQRLEAMAMSANEALYRLSEHARGDLGAFIGLSHKEIVESEHTRLLKKYKRTVVSLSDVVTEERIEIELYDAQAALVHILKERHLAAGEPTERAEVVTMTDAERAVKIAELMTRAQERRAAAG